MARWLRDCAVACSAAPEITSTSSNVEAKLSETAVLDCHVTGTPTPTVEWLFNGQPLDRTDQRYYVTTRAALTISDVKVADTGRYTCRANNSAGVDERDVHLDVLGMSSPH